MEKPTVEVAEITSEKDILAFVAKHAPQHIKIGDESPRAERVEARFNALRLATRSKDDKIFLLSWRGTIRSPYGAKVLDYEIGLTQHGLVRTVGGKIIGTYERISDCCGVNLDENEMIVFIKSPR